MSETLRDRIAIIVMQSEIESWNNCISTNQRQDRIRDWINRYGDVTIHEAIAKDCYDIADAMLKARGEK